MKRGRTSFVSGSWLVAAGVGPGSFSSGRLTAIISASRQTDTNMAGLGARVGYKAFSHVML